jgi:hypothetical protein
MHIRRLALALAMACCVVPALSLSFSIPGMPSSFLWWTRCPLRSDPVPYLRGLFNQRIRSQEVALNMVVEAVEGWHNECVRLGFRFSDVYICIYFLVLCFCWAGTRRGIASQYWSPPVTAELAVTSLCVGSVLAGSPHPLVLGITGSTGGVDMRVCVHVCVRLVATQLHMRCVAVRSPLLQSRSHSRRPFRRVVSVGKTATSLLIAEAILGKSDNNQPRGLLSLR